MLLFARASLSIGAAIISAFFIISCQSSTNFGGNIQVNEMGIGPNKEDTEVVHLNNCDGKADATQSIERGQMVQVEGGAQLGVNVQIIEAAVTGKYATSSYASKRIALTAPPKTNMEFTLRWIMDARNGTVTMDGRQALYHHLTPIDVQIQTQKDLGCGTPADVSRSTSAMESPTLSIRPTDTSAPPTSTPLPPTDTLIPPTNTPIPPTPAPTALADTPPGMTLEVGDTWRQGGIELTLLKVSLFAKGKGVGTRWEFRNLRSQDIVLAFTVNNFIVRDNSGRRLEASPYEFVVDADPPWGYVNVDIRTVLRSGERYVAQSDPADMIYTSVDIGNPAITELVVTVANISSINGAKWRIPINH